MQEGRRARGSLLRIRLSLCWWVACHLCAYAHNAVLEACLRLERFLPLQPPQGKGRSELMGAYVERLRTTDRLGVTETWVSQRSAAPLGRTPSRCQTLMPDPDACHADPAATPRRWTPPCRTPPSDPAVGPCCP